MPSAPSSADATKLSTTSPVCSKTTTSTAANSPVRQRPSFRVLTPDVVLVSAHLKVKGQGLVGGGTIDRDNFSLRALQRQDDGSWLIVSEMFQDANTETTYEH